MTARSEAEAFVEAIEVLLEDARYGWARETLTGIRDFVELTDTVSPGQRRAVENIRAARRVVGDPVDDRLPSERRVGSRRYEGWGR